MIAAFHQQNPHAPLQSLCTAQGVSRSWFYERPSAAAPTEEDVASRHEIERVALEFPGYGYRRVTAQLARQGWAEENGRAVNHKRVLRVMREESLLCRLRKRFVVTTDSSHGHRCYSKFAERGGVDAPRPGVGRGHHVHPPPRRLLLLRRRAGRVAFSRRCVGWHLSRDIDTRLTLAALKRGLTERRPAAGLIHHSDRGVRVRARANEYAGGEYVARLESAGALPSMSAKGTPKTLKTEEVYLQEYQNFAEARSNLGPFIEAVYNRKRLHSALGYLPPAEFESAFRENNDKSARLA